MSSLYEKSGIGNFIAKTEVLSSHTNDNRYLQIYYATTYLENYTNRTTVFSR